MGDIVEEVEMKVENDENGTVKQNVEVNQERQRRKRPRPRRKRKIGKGAFRKILPANVQAQEVRRKMFFNGQPNAPYNTTQFLIEDHGALQNIDAQLSTAPGTQKHARTRDSSFSIDSDDDYFYSSPEDEEEFLTKEFSLEYEDLHVERLASMPKAEIVRDYLLLEGKYEKAMAELRALKGEEPGKVTDSGRDTDASVRSDGDSDEKLRLGYVELKRLKAELEKLKREKTQLQDFDSESDSSSSSSSDSSSSSGSSLDKFLITISPKPTDESDQSSTAVAVQPSPGSPKETLPADIPKSVPPATDEV